MCQGHLGAGGWQEGRPPIRQEIHVGLDAVSGLLAETKDAQRHPGVRGRNRDLDRRAIPDLLAALGRGVTVENGGKKDGAPTGVELQDFWGVRR